MFAQNHALGCDHLDQCRRRSAERQCCFIAVGGPEATFSEARTSPGVDGKNITLVGGKHGQNAVAKL
jgi:3-hydroxyisobutyrate dehydrogenase-like beta-hydroxyacid dehydrogenase